MCDTQGKFEETKRDNFRRSKKREEEMTS